MYYKIQPAESFLFCGSLLSTVIMINLSLHEARLNYGKS